MQIEVIILAAGAGKRMHSALPKPLHQVGGKPMLVHIILALQQITPARMHIVIGHNGNVVRTAIEKILTDESINLPYEINWVQQEKQLGTGQAVQCALPHVQSEYLLIAYGDTPLIRADTFLALTNIARQNKTDHKKIAQPRIALLTCDMQDAAYPVTGLGRILRDKNHRITAIIEEKDANMQQRKITECNAGVICGSTDIIKRAALKLTNTNNADEFYLTDIIAIAAKSGYDIISHMADINQTLGVNSHTELARIERLFQRQQANKLLKQGVQIIDPARVDIRGNVKFGRDCLIDINVILEGEVAIGDGCVIGANSIVRNSRLGNNCIIEPNCIIDGADISSRCRIGPFARIRPQTELAAKVNIGNFVEVKKSRVGTATKISHLSYIGDSEIGARVNVGAGVITCNFDGATKHRTVIGDNVFIGSNSQLIAPLTIGAGATIAAGSTITKDVDPAALSITRPAQKQIANWRRPKK